jgi:hypothetical protein
VQFVQSCHASLEAGKHFCRDPAAPVDHLIVLTVPDEPALLAAQERAESRDIRTVLFREPDFGDIATSLCTEPIRGEKRKVFSSYPLWKEKELCQTRS